MTGLLTVTAEVQGSKLEVEGKHVAIRHLQFSLIQWVLMGDLNATLEETEKEGGRNFDRREGEFLANFLFEIGGVDLGCGSGMTTWQNSRYASKKFKKRLDRVVTSALWCTEFPKACVEKFPIIGSDYAPILLRAWGEGPKLWYPFHFLELLTSRPDCEKLKELHRRLADVQNKPITDALVEIEAEIQLEIMEMEGRMDRIWKKKSCENWLQFGDDNTKFFHASTFIRRRQNFIGSIIDNSGRWLRQRDEIGDHF
ncbi:uncharacterized protein LOC133036869 [Cannabis sativa]|uniref:uncharacterized protein LOC133036869 n=1 Tax=Cannabis sativa TaxID=3483 RepID=UPI0029CA8B51|nr:uncharacterized protein LOC133036869 [Cannabis sativa]